MAPQVAGVQKAISGNPYRNDGLTVFQAGNASPTLVTRNVTLLTNQAGVLKYGSLLVAAVSPVSSGNTGTMKAVSSSNFGGFYNGSYIAIGLTTSIGGVANTVLLGGAADTSARRPIAFWTGYDRLNITSWNAVTGAATKGSANGVKIAVSGIDGQLGRNADNAVRYNTNAVPGELVFMTGALAAPTQVDYASKTSP